MAFAGQVIDNPLSGERIIFHRTAAATRGRLLAFTYEIAPGRAAAGRRHPRQDQRFEVIAGHMRFHVGRVVVEAGRGDVVHVPAGAAHRFGNAGDEAAVVNVEIRPALRTEELIEAVRSLIARPRRLRWSY